MKKGNMMMALSALALAAVVVFAGCSDSGGSDSGMENGYLGNSFTISDAQVYEESSYNGNGEPVYTEITGNYTVTTGLTHVTASVTGGKLTLTAGTPPATQQENLRDFFDGDGLTNVVVSPTNANAAVLSLTSGDYDFNHEKAESVISGYNVSYIYVDRDVTITGTGGTGDEDGIPVTYANLNLTLKTGWNAIYGHFSFSGGGVNVSMGAGIPAGARWVRDNN